MKQKRVLVGVLNWGLGHACRMIPVINALQQKDWVVEIASDGHALAFLKKEFPECRFHEFANLNIRYQRKGFLWFKMFCQLPAFYQSIRLDQYLIKHLSDIDAFDLIVSDNRYGFYSKRHESILITHQLFPPLPKVFYPFRFMLNRWIAKQASHFNRIWIPDYKVESQSLSGRLSHALFSYPKSEFIGPVSRLFIDRAYSEKDIDLLCILSGPEPQRTMLEKQIIEQMQNSSYQTVIIRGISDSVQHYHSVSDNLSMVNYVLSTELSELLKRSSIVLSRCGYTSVMDYWLNGCRAILIPTPGQWEQEYLARHLAGKALFTIVSQKNLDIHKIIKSGFREAEIKKTNRQEPVLLPL